MQRSVLETKKKDELLEIAEQLDLDVKGLTKAEIVDLLADDSDVELEEPQVEPQVEPQSNQDAIESTINKELARRQSRVASGTSASNTSALQMELARRQSRYGGGVHEVVDLASALQEELKSRSIRVKA